MRGSVDVATAEVNGRVRFLRRAEIRGGMYWLLQHATLLAWRDTLTWTGGWWRRTAGDTIEFREGSTFPSVLWRLVDTPAGLAGEGAIVSDAIFTTPNGKVHRPSWRWPVNVVHIDCDLVPKRPPGWPSGS